MFIVNGWALLSTCSAHIDGDACTAQIAWLSSVYTISSDGPAAGKPCWIGSG